MSTTFPQILSTEAARLMLPLRDLDTPEELERFLGEEGYSFTGVLGGLNLSALVADIDLLITRIEDMLAAVTDQDRANAALALLDQIIAVGGTARVDG